MMEDKDLFSFGDAPDDDTAQKNAPDEISVSELSQRLKRTIEDRFGYVRVRGELSKVTVAKSGHLYTALKDDSAVLDSVCWKGTLQRLSIRPEEGMDVVCTGRLTTYPGRSNYQLIIESMELAGQGALLKMLEERRKKLAAEGLFDESRKQPIPYLPRRIGVVTSPTGAVIRDILHRLSDRFPVHVIVWPVMVQGAGAAQQVTAAINGFNTLPENSPYRPDVLIVARGGGSIEDLMPFNDESVVRAAAASRIPLISAVGHETDTTLIDYASDLRAPTPTGAAEKAVPVLADLRQTHRDLSARLDDALRRRFDTDKRALVALARALPDPRRLLDMRQQQFDHVTLRLDGALTAFMTQKSAKLAQLAAGITPLALRHMIARAADMLQNLHNRQTRIATTLVEPRQERLGVLSERLARAGQTLLPARQDKLASLSALLEAMSFNRVLERGFALVTDKNGKPVTSAKTLTSGDAVTLRLKDGTSSAKID